VLKEFGKLHDCYKILLDCADHNVDFYEKVSTILYGLMIYNCRMDSN